MEERKLCRRLIRVLRLPPQFHQLLPTDSWLPHTFDSEEKAFLALGKLFNHPWFQRIWVVQEVVVAKTVHIMHDGASIDWDTLVPVVRMISSNVQVFNRMGYYRCPKITTSAVDLKVEPKATFRGWQL
jgi:hypothetical protein